MTLQELCGNTLSMWIGLELLLEDASLSPMKQEVLADSSDEELIAFLLASAETELAEDELNEQLQFFLVVLYSVAAEQLARFPVERRRPQLSLLLAKMLESKPIMRDAFPDTDAELFLDGMLEGRPELMDTSVITLGCYLVLELSERVFEDFDTKMALQEIGARALSAQPGT